MVDSEDSFGRPPKVARLIEEYHLDGIGPEFERLWTTNGDDRWSLRELADRFNHELLRSAMTSAGMQTVTVERDTVYRLLTNDDVSEADRMRIRRRLEREGIDVEGLLEDFVSYQAIRTYLQSYRGAEYSRDEQDRLATEMETIQQLNGRTVAVVEGKLEGLQSNGYLDVGNFRTLVRLSVVCKDCETRYDVTELLEAGACDCPDEG